MFKETTSTSTALPVNSWRWCPNIEGGIVLPIVMQMTHGCKAGFNASSYFLYRWKAWFEASWLHQSWLDTLVKASWEAIFRVTDDFYSSDFTSHNNTCDEGGWSGDNTSHNNTSHNNTLTKGGVGGKWWVMAKGDDGGKWPSYGQIELWDFTSHNSISKKGGVRLTSHNSSSHNKISHRVIL